MRREIVGPDGGAQAALVELTDRLDVADHVTFRGAVTDAVPSIARASAFVHPARSGTVGLVPPDALCVGVPVIAADCTAGGPRRVRDGGRYRRLVAPESVDDLANALVQRLNEHAALRAARAAAALPYLREHFSVEAAVQASLEVLDRVAGRRHDAATTHQPQEGSPR